LFNGSGVASDKTVDCFDDEWRSFVFVDDICKSVEKIIDSHIPGKRLSKRIFHLGGKEDLSRFDFAKILCKIRGYSPSAINGIYQSEVNLGYARPPNLSIDSKFLCDTFDIKMTATEDALKSIFAS